MVANEVQTALVGGGAGLVTGTIGALVAPWVNWKIERVKLRHASRQERVTAWRLGLNETHIQQGAQLLEHSWYQTLRSHLTPEVRVQVERDDTILVIQGRPNWVREELNNEVDRIERDWDLI